MIDYPNVKFLTRKRKASPGKAYRGDSYRVNAPGLRGSSVFHSPTSPKIEMFADPDVSPGERRAIGRYGEVGSFKSFPLILLKAASVASKEVYNNPLDYSIARRTDSEGVSRRRYSQFREAASKVIATLIMHTNIEYGMVGKVHKGQFYHMSLQEIATHAGVGYERAKRVIRVLRDKGALKVSKQFERLTENSFEGHNSIRHLTQGFWAMFGFGQWMKHEKSKRSGARRAKSSGEVAVENESLLADKWEPKREKVMAQMQSQAIMDIYLKEAQDLLKC